MSVRQFACPSCGQVLQVAAEVPAGAGVRCPRCKNVCRLGAPAAPPPPAPSPVAPRPAPPPPPAPPRSQSAPKKAPAQSPPKAPPKAVRRPQAIPGSTPAPAGKSSRSSEEQSLSPSARGGRPSRRFLYILLALFLLCSGIGTVSVLGVFYYLWNRTQDLPEHLNPPPPKAENLPDGGGAGRPIVEDKPAPPTPARADLRFIPGDFMGAIVLRPERVLAAQLVTALIPPELLAAVPTQLGLDLLELDRVVVLIDPFPGGNVAFFPGGILSLKRSGDGNALLRKVLKDVEATTLEGKPILRSKAYRLANAALAGHVADDRTLLIAPEPTLKKMLAAGTPPSGALVDLLTKTELSRDITAALVMHPVRNMAAAGVKENNVRESLPPQFAGVASLPEQANTLTLQLDLEGDTLAQMSVEVASDAAAADIETLIGNARTMLRQSRADLEKSVATDLPHLVKEFMAIADQIPEGMTIARQGKVVQTSLRRPRGLVELTSKLAPMLFGAFDLGGPRPFVSKKHGFQATFPTPPLEKLEKSPQGGETPMIECRGTDGIGRYSVAISPMPGALTGAAARGYLEVLAAGFDAKTVKSRSNVDVKGYTGLEMVLTVEQGGLKLEMAQRFVLVKKRMYHLMVVYLATRKDAARVEAFFDSFAPLEEEVP